MLIWVPYAHVLKIWFSSFIKKIFRNSRKYLEYVNIKKDIFGLDL